MSVKLWIQVVIAALGGDYTVSGAPGCPGPNAIVCLSLSNIICCRRTVQVFKVCISDMLDLTAQYIVIHWFGVVFGRCLYFCWSL